MKTTPVRSPRIKINWTLSIGILLIAGVACLAIAGPSIAPRDPLQENRILRDELTGEWHIPPFTAFEVTGFPLGSDEFGRDLYSRLLHAIRPTLQMVLVVASVRLAAGTLIGLAAGWSVGRAGRIFDSLISSALALPGLLVALGTIAVIGVEKGLLAFIIGLSITGWAETARLVREQTRIVRQEVYVEAARALGATDAQILFRHVLRQIRAMLLMMLALEVGSSLMLTAGLGFLGYYIGGDVWVDVADFVARRTSGSPELGQMLATAWVRLTDPWGLVSVGSVVFAAVLGFNLIGEGLRLRISPEHQVGRIKWLSDALAKLRLNLEQAWHPIGRVLFGSRLALGLWWLAIGGAVGWWGVNAWQAGTFALSEAEVNMLFEPAADAAPPAGTNSTVVDASPGETPPPTPQLIWSFNSGGPILGSPVVSQEGIIYFNHAAGLTALHPDGSLAWQVELAARPVGAPALGADGVIHVADRNGSLLTFSPAGELIWQFDLAEPRAAASGPAVGEDGALYYALTGQAGAVQAVSAAGAGLWLGAGQTSAVFTTPSAGAGLVFLKDDVFDAATGALLSPEFPAAIHRFVLGADGRVYARAGHTVMEWRFAPDGTTEILQSFTWPYQSIIEEQSFPLEAGITASGYSWELYTTELGGATRLFIIQAVDGAGQLRYSGGADMSLGTLVALDDATLAAVICGFGDYRYPNLDNPKPECVALMPGTEAALWHFKLDQTRRLVGAAYSGRMLYLATEEGDLFAVDTAPEPPAAEPQEAAATNSGWIFRSPEPLAIPPLVHADGSLYLFSRGTRIVILNADGTLKATLDAPEPLFRLEETGFGGSFFTLLPPVLTADGKIVITTGTRVYALDLAAEVAWEFPLANPPQFAPVTADGTRFYLLDTQSGLYAFENDGLVWQFAPERLRRTVTTVPEPAVGGGVYYIVTGGTRGVLLSVSAEGTLNWETALTTYNFRRDIQVLPSGEWLAVDNDLVRAPDGELVQLTGLEFAPDIYAMGYDGNTYFMVGQTLIQVQVGADGAATVLNQATIAFPEGLSRGIPPRVNVTRDGTFWIEFPTFGGNFTSNMFVNAAGDVLGILDVNTRVASIIALDFGSGRLAYCIPDEDTNSMDCRGYTNGAPEPDWQVTIQGIGDAGYIFYQGGVLYVMLDENTVQTVNVNLP
jgi:ABC-type dipeptide/oligopeptide/nickel transport system permease subunit